MMNKDTGRLLCVRYKLSQNNCLGKMYRLSCAQFDQLIRIFWTCQNQTVHPIFMSDIYSDT